MVLVRKLKSSKASQEISTISESAFRRVELNIEKFVNDHYNSRPIYHFQYVLSLFSKQNFNQQLSVFPFDLVLGKLTSKNTFLKGQPVCLGCKAYFVEGFPIQERSEILFKPFFLIQRKKLNESELSKMYCALLNSKGGCFLFVEKIKPNGTIEEGLNDKNLNELKGKVIEMLMNMKIVHLEKGDNSLIIPDFSVKNIANPYQIIHFSYFEVSRLPLKHLKNHFVENDDESEFVLRIVVTRRLEDNLKGYFKVFEENVDNKEKDSKYLEKMCFNSIYEAVRECNQESVEYSCANVKITEFYHFILQSYLSVTKKMSPISCHCFLPTNKTNAIEESHQIVSNISKEEKPKLELDPDRELSWLQQLCSYCTKYMIETIKKEFFCEEENLKYHLIIKFNEANKLQSNLKEVDSIFSKNKIKFSIKKPLEDLQKQLSNLQKKEKAYVATYVSYLYSMESTHDQFKSLLPKNSSENYQVSSVCNHFELLGPYEEKEIGVIVEMINSIFPYEAKESFEYEKFENKENKDKDAAVKVKNCKITFTKNKIGIGKASLLLFLLNLVKRRAHCTFSN